MKAILALALNDLRLTVRRRSALIWTLLLPIVLMWLLGQQRSGGMAQDGEIRLLLLDRDRGWFAAALAEELGRFEDVALRRSIPGEVDAGSEGEHTVTVPPGLSTALSRSGETPAVELALDGRADSDFGFSARMVVATAIGRTLLRAERAALDGWGGASRPPVGERGRVRLALTRVGIPSGVPTGFAQSVPGTLTMIVLMMTLIYGGMFLAMERQQGQLARLFSVPLSRAQIFWGKLGGRLLIAGVQIVLLLLVGRWLFGFRLEAVALPVALLLGTFALAAAGLGTWLGAVAASPEQAKAFGWIASMVMAGLGGCWWPGELMPERVWQLAHVFPTAWAMDGLHRVVSFGQGLAGALPASLALTAFAALFSLLGARALRP